jgi:transcriptional regulator with XRE-family HTH domain
MDDDLAAAVRGRLVQFGRRVRELREARGLTQEALAHRAGLHRAVVGFIERAEREVGVTTVWPLADALEVDPGEFFRDAAPRGGDGGRSQSSVGSVGSVASASPTSK